MPWGGYNFEDSILISERLVKNDLFTSIHIEEFECVARDTKLGKEEITRDIPNVGEEALKDLDESGIVRIGAEVKPQDILVGKITPKGETQLSPEEKLLRAIFGEKAGDVRDSSLRVPPGVQGIVISAQVFSRKGTEKDERAKDIEDPEKEKLLADQRDEVKIISESYYAKMRKLLRRQDHGGAPGRRQGQGPLRQGAEDRERRRSTRFRPATGPSSRSRRRGKTEEKLEQLAAQLEEDIDAIEALYREKISQADQGRRAAARASSRWSRSTSPSSASCRSATRWPAATATRASSRASCPRRTCRTCADGTPVDIVLNPLGVPSRMNIGQILETHLGWAALELGKQIDAMIQQASGRATPCGRS